MASTDRSVWELQEILKTLGAPVEVTKQYDPITARTWSLLTSRLGLSPSISQVTPLVAKVDADAYAKLLNEYILRKAPKPMGANDFERLNNAIVLLDGKQQSNQAAQSLANDWNRIATDPAWRSFVGALPPVWATSLMLFWSRYFDVWTPLTTNEKTQLVHPATIEPGGVFSANAWNDLWDPALSSALSLGQSLAQKAGKELAKGAAEETQKQTWDWLWGLSGLALGATGIWWLLRRPQRTRRAA